jgi:anti-sigma factor RsiW
MATPDVQQLTCKELVELVTDYLEGALSPADRARFDEHLATCPYCRTYVEQMRQTIRALGHLPEETIPAEALEELLARFRRWR